MKTRLKNICLTFLAVFVLFGCNEFMPLPSDQEMIGRFEIVRPDLETLLKMSDEDRKVIRIAYDFTRLDNDWNWPRPGTELGFTEARWEEYKKLFKRIGLRSGIERSEEGSIFFLVAGKGLGNGHGLGKGYAYMTTQPSPILKSLNEDQVSTYYREHPEHKAAIYRELKQSWYIFADH